MKEHIIKCLSEYFSKVETKEKTFELRKNDRDYKVGDRLILVDIDKEGQETGKTLSAIITYCISGPIFGLMEGWCILSIRLGKRQGNANTGRYPSSDEEAVSYGVSIGMTELSAKYCLAYYTKTKWHMASGLAIADWKAAFRQWKLRDQQNDSSKRPEDKAQILLPRILRRAANLSLTRKDAIFQDIAMGAVVSHYGWDNLRNERTFSGYELSRMLQIYRDATNNPFLGVASFPCNPASSLTMKVPSIPTFEAMLKEKAEPQKNA